MRKIAYSLELACPPKLLPVRVRTQTGWRRRAACSRKQNPAFSQLIAPMLLLVLCAPYIAHAGYGEGAYYSQSYYQTYYQATYQTTFSTSTLALSDFTVLGQINKGSGSFVIDHPLDPLNQLLFHSFVESPDAMDFYDGIAVLNSAGEAMVTLPNYFMALNKDFRYQLKPVGVSQPNLHIKTEIAGNHFEIGGGAPNARVSWQVTGTRHDPYIIANPIVVEVKKGPDALVPVGEYLHPDVWQPSLPQKLSAFVAWLRNRVGL